MICEPCRGTGQIDRTPEPLRGIPWHEDVRDCPDCEGTGEVCPECYSSVSPDDEKCIRCGAPACTGELGYTIGGRIS